MQLVSFRIKNFKRFAGDNKIVLDGKLVSIVGPNDAGKTSLLRALEHFNHPAPFETSGPSQETTRDVKVSPNERVIEATYWVTDQDRIGLDDVPEAQSVRWVTISKPVGGKTFNVGQTPTPKRDLTSRLALSREIMEKKSLLLERFPPRTDDDSDAEQQGCFSPEDIDSVLEILNSEDEELANTDIQTLREFASQISSSDSEHERSTRLSESLLELCAYQDLKPPEERSRNYFYEREPKFLLFSEENRVLKSEYSLVPYFRENDLQDVPVALGNLAEAAGLDLRLLYNAAKIEDHGEIDSLIDAANAKLESLLTTNWSQSKVSARFRQDGTTLHILAGFRGSKFVRIAERSDGLRQYIALLAFLSRQPTQSSLPILLIDEAETHLHYDAQADLVQMLAKQEVAAKVIYTTHSVGCLPEDLGYGIRMVKTNEQHSTIVNWFWESDTPGFSPLLFAVGASTLAFVPIRNALLTEGASDILLLPTMFRDATGLASLQFQVAPGLSKAHPNEVAIVDSQSPSTVYLVDADPGGQAIKQKLLSAGIKEGHIIGLPPINETTTTIEDFVDRASLARAVNSELARSHDRPSEISVDDIVSPGAIASIEVWCDANQLPHPKKRAVAYQLLENRYTHPVLAAEHSELLRNLHNAISSILELS